MRVYHRCFLTLACVLRGGIESGVCFSLFMVSACYWRGRLCFSRGRDRGFVLYISLFVGGLEVGHTHKLLGYLMWAQVWDGHQEGQKNPDRLKRSIHVDRIGVHSTFVYIYAVLRVNPKRLCRIENILVNEKVMVRMHRIAFAVE